MLEKTKGIVLNFIKYKESSIIVKTYTEAFGLQSYIINGIRSKKGKVRIGLFQPLTLLDLVVYYKEQQDIKRISEVKCLHPYKSIPFEHYKTSIAMFIAEILTKTLKEETGNKELFDFLLNSLLYLDKTEDNYQNFHLQFLVKYAMYHGFAPSQPEDVVLGVGLPEEKELIGQLLKTDYPDLLNTTNHTRRKVLEHILKFYEQNLDGLGQIKSYKILQEIFK